MSPYFYFMGHAILFMPRFIEPGDCRDLRLGYKKDDKTIEEVLETNYRIHAGEQSVLHAYVHCSG